jgi:hypothetical protein
MRLFLLAKVLVFIDRVTQVYVTRRPAGFILLRGGSSEA